jgi:hypothetical protein
MENKIKYPTGPTNDPTASSSSKWWLGSIILPPACIGLGYGLAYNVHVAQGDMIGLLPLLCIVGGATVGCVLSITCTVTSVMKSESWSGAAIVFSLGYLIFILKAWIG